MTGVALPEFTASAAWKNASNIETSKMAPMTHHRGTAVAKNILPVQMNKANGTMCNACCPTNPIAGQNSIAAGNGTLIFAGNG